MIPTRAEIHEKLGTIEGDKQTGISSWLDDMECPEEDKLKILSDLVSYDNY